MNRQLTIICANDNMEVAFLPDTSQEIIDTELERLKDIIRDEFSYEGLLQHVDVHVHVHEVKVFENEQDKNKMDEEFADMDEDNAQGWLSEVMHNTGLATYRKSKV